MRLDKTKELCKLYNFCYFITITVRKGFADVNAVYRIAYSYLHNRDKLARFITVKELGKNRTTPHYHLLYFTNKELDYSKLHEHLKRHKLQHYDIRIERIRKEEQDITDIIRYLSKEREKK